MKYFNLKILAKCGSGNDDLADAAAEQWNKSIAAYPARLKEIRGRLPIEVRNLCNRFTLHDAKVILTALHKSIPLFTVLLQLEGTPSQPGDALQLVYITGAKPHFRKASTSEGQWILYDEFDLAKNGEGFTHSLLLTNGSEIQIPFQKFSFQVIEFSRLSEAVRLRVPNLIPALRGSA